LPAKVPINTNQNFINTEKRGSKNKYKSSIILSTSSNGKKQSGRKNSKKEEKNIVDFLSNTYLK
jgi:hypothetical protein